MAPARIPALALAADLVAVVVFAAIGRVSHAEADSLLGLLGTAAPFVVGAGAAWVSPWVRAAPASMRAGGIVVAGAVVVGLLLRLGFTGSLPATFALVTAVSLAVLMLGWRTLAMLVARLGVPGERRTPGG
ncbi:DUF3054 domain-containing protein [Pseudonocardia sp. KRD291]|uniref:DUF3054 domain-containing protein n=1 Tax=Pseudonocardia sp. KRD291 TaxID=2792007 RepID=UPI001C49F7C0|nr:DUF3054 domain-containing protein [Pseudonocardia sp. KRD291]MBW0104754.1 DUF3054 domain-containing protein [Pseudonocardia sp. KRD291]